MGSSLGRTSVGAVIFNSVSLQSEEQERFFFFSIFFPPASLVVPLESFFFFPLNYITFCYTFHL